MPNSARPGRAPRAPATCRRRRRRRRRRTSRAPAVARQSCRDHVSCRARGSTSRGSEKETWHIDLDLAATAASTTRSAIARHLSAQRSGAGRCGHRRARRAAPISRSPAARLRETLTDDVSLGPAPDMLFQLDLLHHRRRAAAEGEGARLRRRPRRRRRHARRARRAGKISRHPARSRSLHRSARSAAAAALFDLVVAEGRRPAACR